MTDDVFKEDTRIVEALTKLKPLLESAGNAINLHVVAEVKIADQDGWTSDSAVIIKTLYEDKAYETGYVISAYVEQYQAFAYTEPVERVFYYVQHEVCYPGVRYYPDGSGEPDDYELIDDHKTQNPYDAIKKALTLHIEHILCQHQENEAMEEQLEDEEL